MYIYDRCILKTNHTRHVGLSGFAFSMHLTERILCKHTVFACSLHTNNMCMCDAAQTKFFSKGDNFVTGRSIRYKKGDTDIYIGNSAI